MEDGTVLCFADVCVVVIVLSFFLSDFFLFPWLVGVLCVCLAGHPRLILCAISQA